MSRFPRLRFPRTFRVWSLAAVAAYGLTGIALATIPSANGTIAACYSKSGGTLRIIDSSVTNCKASETAISWNTVGPQGPTGPTGPQGPQGAIGPVGPSHAYFQSQGSASGAPFHTIATLTVPAGSYVIDARTVLFGGKLATCFLRYSTLPGPGDPIPPPGDGLQIVMPVPTVFNDAEVLISLHDAQTLPGPGTTDITFNCTNEPDQFDSSTVLRATLVGGLN